jgi:hypothetical protein
LGKTWYAEVAIRTALQIQALPPLQIGVAEAAMARLFDVKAKFALVIVGFGLGPAAGGPVLPHGATFVGWVVMAFTGSTLIAQSETDNVKKQFKSENYTVTWGAVAKYGANAELEIGDGSGHGFTLGWMRFKPTNDRVDILSLELDQGQQPYKSKWPPDRAPVVVKRGQMKPDAYTALLRDVAIVDAAKLQPTERTKSSSSSRSFWVNTSLTANKKALIDLNWAGYKGSSDESKYAKPQASVSLVRAAVENIDFKEHTLTDEERSWASANFTRDWKRFKDLKSHWWVRERYIILTGVVGDATALPTLREILGGDPNDHCVYYAVNAITRLAKKDLRDKPVEEMDVEKTRRKILDLLREAKDLGK